MNPESSDAAGKNYIAYKNDKLPIEMRIADLLSRMTLDEKIRQLDMYRGSEIMENDRFSFEKISTVVGDLGMGSLHDLLPISADISNQIQEYAVKKTRLGIPILFIEEALHGYNGKGSTTFPIPLALAGTWDKAFIEEVGRVIAKETRAHGVQMVLGPVLDLSRDPRWGRIEETYGEDPFLTSQIGLAMIKGLQGNDVKNNDSVVAEPKHFAIHGIPESGSNAAPVFMGEREARSGPLSVFETVFHKGGALATMAAYHELDGIPCTANSWLLTELLRKEWGFNGFVLSDMGAIGMQIGIHKIAATPKEALSNALKAGVDMQFYDFSHPIFRESILEGVKDGSIPIEVIDRAVQNILRVKFLLGLFENPYTKENLIQQRFHTGENRNLALRAGEESICLLKNENSLLPLKKNIKSIAVIGPMADVSVLGGYSPKEATAVTVLNGIRQLLGISVSVRYEPGIYPQVIPAIVESKYLSPALPKTSDKSFSGVQGAVFQKSPLVGLKAEYFNNPNLEGQPVLTRIETDMMPYWGLDSPGPSVNSDHFSVRWTGTITAPVTGSYELGIVTDDRGRLYIGDKLLVDNWENYKSNVMMTCEMQMKAGQPYPIRIEYGEEVDYAGMRFKWCLKSEDNQLDSTHPISLAVEAAKKSDVVVLVVGESSDLVGEGKDRANLDLDAFQTRLIKAVFASGTPTVMVLLNGRPLTLDWINKNIPAIIEAWFPGESGGIAVAKVLFGEINPSGKLPVTFPLSLGHLPVYYNRKPSSNRSYIDMDSRPVYSFGHGLSYTTFKYSNLVIDTEGDSKAPMVNISVDIENSGLREGAEVVQLYLRDNISSVTTPIMELKGFEKVRLASGEKKTVRFKLGFEELALWNREMKQIVEPGEFSLMVGSSSEDIRLNGSFTIH